MSQSQFLVIPRMTVANINLMQTWWLAAAPGPMVALGFAHNLARQLGVEDLGVGIVHHDMQMLAEKIPGTWALQPQQYRAAGFINKQDYAKDGHSLSLQPTFKGHLKVSVVIELQGAAVSLAAVEQFLETARYAGGIVNRTGRPAIYGSLDEARATLKAGFAVHDRTPWMQEAIDQGQDPLDALLELTSGECVKEYPWSQPALLGYATLTEFAQRLGVREDAPHAFAEPLVGLVQYCSVREGLPLWRYSRPSDSVFLATQSQP